jgi:endoglucanase
MNTRSTARSIRIVITCLLMLPAGALAQLRSPTYGWNLGNTLEAPSGVGTWAPAPTQALINAVADAGFNTVRIPCAWDSNANQSTFQINSTYMAQVKQVVDWCYARNLTVIINIHWDNGWLENNITGSVNSTINAKMNSYWTQIATTFRNYDSRLLFAGANEPHVETAAQMSTLTAYYQTFVNAVRNTGGNNTSRWLIVQGPSTNIDRTNQLMNTLPNDPTPGRMIVEVHYYDPYQYALMTADESWGKRFYFWGEGYRHPTRTDRNPNWGEEAWAESQFQLMYDKFVSRGIPVLLGEFGAIRRTGYSDLTGSDLNLHLASRTYFNKTLVDKANSKGIRPVYWDDSGTNPNSFGLFNRNTAALVDVDSARSLTGGPALPPPGGTTLNVSVTSMPFGSGAGSQSSSITSNTSWTASDNQSWITVSPSSGSGNGTLTVSVTQNTGASRSGTVTVTGGGLTRTISVTQSAAGGGSTVTIQAESGAIAGGTTIESNNAGFNGTGFANFPASGGTLTFNNVDGSGGGAKTLTIRYANGAAARGGSITVNGVISGITFQPTGSWTTWQTMNVTVMLGNNSTNTIRFTSTGQDLGNIDEITLSSTPPPPVTYQGESGVIAGGVTIENNNAGFNGSGFANFPASGGTLTFNNVEGNGGGAKSLAIRYANGGSTARTGTITVNGVTFNLTFQPTASWSAWATMNVTITLNNNSTNTIRFASTGQDLANIDEITVP